MIPFGPIMGALSAALGLSLIVERILEYGKNLLTPKVGTSSSKMVPSQAEAERAGERLLKTMEADNRRSNAESIAENLSATLDTENDEQKKDKIKEDIAGLEGELEYDERTTNTIILVEPATDPDDGRTMRAFILQILGFAVGIILARSSGLQLFHSMLGADVHMSVAFDYLLTGLLIGGGSGPIHILIRFITQRKVSTESEAAPAETAEKEHGDSPISPVLVIPPAASASVNWIDIPYRGGVDREKLEGVHLRKANPDLVVYHHTAMNLNSTFEDVVRVIKDRTDSNGNHWITGYNCVVTSSGAIHPFCRWDRYGNHAAGYNRRSLGIAFNGNFETNASVSYSNPDRRYGNPRPTEAQLKAGARVIALWHYLYQGIAIDYEKNILPHKYVSSKTCPGSNFPYDEMKKWIDFYVKQWGASQQIREVIEAYKLKPYLYV